MRNYYVLLVMLVTLLAACATNADNTDSTDTKNKDPKDVAVENVKPSVLEEGLLHLIGDFPIALELQINNEAAEEIELTVDYYKNGELQSTEMYFTSDLTDIDFSNSVHVVITGNTVNDEQQWISSVITKNSSSSIHTDFTDIPTYESGTFEEVTKPFSLRLGEKKIIGASILQKDDSPMNNTIQSEDDLTDPANDYVYVYYLVVK